MNIHEYQAKAMFRESGVSVQRGVHCTTVEQALSAYDSRGSDVVAEKSQIHAGGRGKAGGIKIVNNIHELKKEAKNLFGKKLVTPQTGTKGKKVLKVYVEQACEIKKEFYLGIVLDRSKG